MKNLAKIKELTDTLTRVEENLSKEKIILEFILENTTDGYWDWNMVTNYEYLSPKLKAQLGYEDHEMENKPEAWMEMCLDLEKANVAIQAHIKGDTPDFRSVVRYTHKKGHVVSILCRGKIVEFDEDGKPTRMIGTHVIIH
jgi:PAS domain-containing protein